MGWKRLLRRTSFVILTISAGLVIFLHSCDQYRMSDEEIDTFFSDKKYKGVSDYYYVGNQRINYLTIGNDSLPLVVFVHGSPASLSAFIHFMIDEQLLRTAQLVSVDRPGFGESNFGYAEPSLERQAAELKPILDKHRTQRPIILVGHSFGGPVIARIAMDYPHLVDGLVFVAASIDPDLEPKEWFRAPLATPFLKWMLPRVFRASNDEIYKLKPELQKMIPLWPRVQARSVVIQGLRDDFVHPRNADFAKKMIINAQVELVIVDSMNHFVPWSHPELIRDAILELASPRTAAHK